MGVGGNKYYCNLMHRSEESNVVSYTLPLLFVADI